MTTTGEGVAHYDVTRLGLVEALRGFPLTSPMTAGALVKMADVLLGQMPGAAAAGFYMEGVKAERTRIEDLFGRWIDILMQEPNAWPPEAWREAFAGLIRREPQP